MSEVYDKEYIIEEIPSSKTEETTIILSLIEEISKLEEKILELKKSLSMQSNQDIKKKEIENLKLTKNKLSEQMNNLSLNLLLDISNKENLIKKKSYLIKDITKKINNYKNILSTYNTLTFNSPILKKYINSNKANHFLSDEQIDDIMSKTQTIYNNDNLIQKYEKEYAGNKEELINIENDKKKILQKINEIKENLKMMKEEKITIKNELINYISLKETLESIIKVNLPSIVAINKEDSKEEKYEKEIKSDSRNFEKTESFISNKEINSNNRVNTINSISEEDNENNNHIIEIDSNSFFNVNYAKNISKKTWDEIINLYKYEFFYLDPNKISSGISNELFDTISTAMINENGTINNPVNKNNLGNSIVLESKKATNNILGKVKSSAFNKDNNRYNGPRNKLIFSCESPIIKKTKTNIFLFNDINDCKKEIQVELKTEIQNFINNINNLKTSIENFIEKISNLLIDKLNEYGHALNKKNLLIYLTCYFKNSFYECMISLKLKFVNKDYKSFKKNKKKKIENLHDQLTKLNTRSETIKNTIILQENKIKLLNKIENQDNKKIKEKNELNNNIGNLKLTLDEQNYIQLCRKANSFINEKNEIEREIEENENDKKLIKYQGEIKINSIKNEINNKNNEINIIEKELFDNKAKIDEDIVNCRKLITDNFNKIKKNLEKFKKKCLNVDINIYNEFLDNISNNIDNKYYKSLLNLEKYNLKKERNITPSQNKLKSKETKSNIESYNYNDKDYDNYNRTSYGNNSLGHKKTTSDLIKPFSLEEGIISSVNNPNIKLENFLNYKNEKTTYDISSASKKKKFLFNNKNRVKDNNYINIFDSCNNLNNYYFQFQTPSTIVSIDDNKKLNTNLFLNNTNKINKNEINILSHSSQFSSNSKLFNSNKKFFSPRQNLKPTNLMNKLKFSPSDKKTINSDLNNNNTINVEEFKLNLNNIKNLYTSKSKIQKKNDNIANNLLSSFSKENNYYIIDENKAKTIHMNFVLKKTFCYFRIINIKDNYKKYNPLGNISIEQLGEPPYNFIKSSLSFDKNQDMIKIFPFNQLETIDIKIDIIENVFIDSNMGIIIDLFLGYKKFKNTFNNENIEKYVKEIKKKGINFNNLKDEEIKKFCNNRNFVFNINIKTKQKIEFLFCSYEEFKLWNNAICFFIKNNSKSLFNLTNRKKFEYP